MIIRDPLPGQEPQEIHRRPHPLLIKHPHFNLPLFYFPALSTGSPTTPYGVSRLLVLDACRVITNHAANGQGDFLSTDIHGQDHLDIDDTPLDVDCYYFLGAPEVEANRDYPTVKTLSTFRFPSILPPHWSRIAQRRPPRPFNYRIPIEPNQMSNLVLIRDQVCNITRCPDGTQCAYLIPKADEPWFYANRMDVNYMCDPMGAGGIDHPANGMLLRADIRLCLDAHAFVFYPACAGSSSTGDNANDNDTFVAYFVRQGYTHLPDLFHRRAVAIPQDVPVEFLYARFAHAIINLPRYEVGFRAIPEMPDVGVMRRRIREVRRQERVAISRAQEAVDASSEDGGEEDEGEEWCVGLLSSSEAAR